MDMRHSVEGCGLDSWGQGPVAGCCEHSEEHLGS